MSDPIDRKKAINTVNIMTERCTTGDIIDLRDMICESLAVLPTADTDISEYSSRLWKLAYERGKTEGIVLSNISAIDQIRWERDTAIEQLSEIGKGLGERMDDVEKVVRCKDCKFASYEPYKDFINVYICNYSYPFRRPLSAQRPNRGRSTRRSR